MLKVGGQRVYPLEIERAIARHPAVHSVAVVGATDRVRGEVPRAVVTVNEGHELEVQEIRAHCRAHLEGFKVPRTIEIWSELPRMPNGKLDKGAIRAAPAHDAEPNGGD
jgi:acyl-CoA synthetase (AMP-forming)/AMP-acid ligase II